MNFFQAFFLGILQGIAEFLPISSSGHLKISREWMGLAEVPRLFDVLLHVASLIVIIWVYRNKVGELIQALHHLLNRKKNMTAEDQLKDRANRRLVLLLLLSTFCSLGIFIILDKSGLQSQRWLTGSAFLFTGVFLLVTRFLPPASGKKPVSLLQSILIGLAQGIGTIPGISRSGITIGSARFMGMEREQCGEYSFLLSIPAILGALLLDLKDGGMLMDQIAPLMLLTAFLTTLVVGYFSLKLLLNLLKSGKFYLFSFYLIPLGVVVLLLQK